MIICDTNIWYAIGSGAISKSQLPDEDLVFTYVSLREMANSSNLYKDAKRIQDLQNAVLAVNRYASPKIFDNPFDLIYSKLKGAKNQKATDGEQIWNDLKHFHKYNVKQILLDKVRILEGEKRLKLMDDEAKIFNSENALRKEYVKKNKLKKLLANSDAPLEFLKGLIIDFLNKKYLSKEEQLDIGDTALLWDSIKLPMSVWTNFDIDILRSGEKLEFNDIGDIINMVYVNDGDQYWTNEKSWIRRISQSPQISKYLFQLS